MIEFLSFLKNYLNIGIAVKENSSWLDEFHDYEQLVDPQKFISEEYEIYLENTSQLDVYSYKAILNTISEGVMFVSNEGRVSYYNNQMSELEGIKVHDALGKSLTDLYNIDSKYSEHHIVNTSRTPIIDRFQKYLSSRDMPITTVASTYPVVKSGYVIGTFSVARDKSSVLNLLKRTNKNEIESFIDLTVEIDNNTRYNFDSIVTSSAKMITLIKQAKNIAKYNSNIMIVGETGVGKELIAQGIHNENPMTKQSPFVAMNCSAIPEHLLEGMLFGTVKGAYTDALDKHGLISEAGSGTLFLDEINSMPVLLQSKLLRVIQEKEFRRVGDHKLQMMKCRIIGSTNSSIEECLKLNLIRHDLYYRIAVHVIEVPALRDRAHDIISLAEHFIEKYRLKYGLYDLILSDEAKLSLKSYDYPGNVRELENIIESSLTQLQNNHILTNECLPTHMKKMRVINKKSIYLNDHLRETEKTLVIETLESNNWNVSKSAKDLGIARQNLQYRMKKLNIIKVISHSNW